MNSQKIAGILGTIVAAAVLAIAFMYGPIGKPPPKSVPKVEPAAPSAAPAARREGTGGARGAAIKLPRAHDGPLRNAAAIPIYASNGDVDAS